MSIKIIYQLLTFLIFPTFLIGLLATYFSYQSRVNSQRKTINTPIDSTFYEWKTFLVWGLLPGILLSALSFGVGIPLTWEWIFVFQIVSVAFLILFGYRLIHPVFTMSATTIVYYILHIMIKKGKFIRSYINPLNKSQELFAGELYPEMVARNVLIFIPLIIFATLFVFSKRWDIIMNPRFMKSPRGKAVARYRMKPFWVLPLLLIVPGKLFTHIASWWPTFGWGDQQYTLVLLPILVGLRYTVQAQDPQLAKEVIKKELLYLGIISLLFAGIGYMYPQFALYLLGILFIGGVIVLWRHRSRERRWHFQFGPADDGLRVVAVRKNSPAERMGIQAGDELLVGNGKELVDIMTYYEMVIDNRSYVKLKVRQLDGEVMIVETPIYEEDAYDLGIVLLDNVNFD